MKKFLNISWLIIKSLSWTIWTMLKALTAAFAGLCLVSVMARWTTEGNLEERYFGMASTIILVTILIYMLKLIIEPIVNIYKERKKEKERKLTCKERLFYL
jgi:p-aminobenzoyl-glutamate transporter AbgT